MLDFELHYLPPYSPNPNPIEWLWRLLINEKSSNNVYFKSKRDFKDAIDQCFTVTLLEIAAALVSRMNDNFQVLKPPFSSRLGISKFTIRFYHTDDCHVYSANLQRGKHI